MAFCPLFVACWFFYILWATDILPHFFLAFAFFCFGIGDDKVLPTYPWAPCLRTHDRNCVVFICCYLLVDATETKYVYLVRTSNFGVFAFTSRLRSRECYHTAPGARIFTVDWDFKGKHNHVCDLEQMRTKYQRFRSCYLYMQEIKNDSGLGWNEEKQTVECEEERWQQFCKVIFLNYKNVVSCVTVTHFFIMSWLIHF